MLVGWAQCQYNSLQCSPVHSSGRPLLHKEDNQTRTGPPDSRTRQRNQNLRVRGVCGRTLLYKPYHLSHLKCVQVQVKHQETKVKKSQTTQKHNTKTSKTKKRGGNTTFFFLGYGRCRTVARFLHEHKRSKTTFVQGPRRSRSAGKSQQNKNTQNNKTTRKSPARMRSSKQKQQTRHTKGQEPNKTPTKKICQGTQYSKTCKINYPPRHLVKPRWSSRTQAMR